MLSPTLECRQPVLGGFARARTGLTWGFFGHTCNPGPSAHLVLLPSRDAHSRVMRLSARVWLQAQLWAKCPFKRIQALAWSVFTESNQHAGEAPAHIWLCWALKSCRGPAAEVLLSDFRASSAVLAEQAPPDVAAMYQCTISKLWSHGLFAPAADLVTDDCCAERFL